MTCNSTILLRVNIYMKICLMHFQEFLWNNIIFKKYRNEKFPLSKAMLQKGFQEGQTGIIKLEHIDAGVIKVNDFVAGLNIFQRGPNNEVKWINIISQT